MGKTSPVAAGKTKEKEEGRGEKRQSGNALNSAQKRLTSGQLNSAETSRSLPMASEDDLHVNF